MNFEEFRKEVDKNITSLFNKANDDEKLLLNRMVNVINDLSEEKQALIEYLKEKDKELKENVVNLEEKLRNTSRDSFYYNSHLKTLHRFRAKRELIKEILFKIEKE